MFLKITIRNGLQLVIVDDYRTVSFRLAARRVFFFKFFFGNDRFIDGIVIDFFGLFVIDIHYETVD